MKKIICLVLSAVIILSGFTFAYADDPEEAPVSSSGTSAYSIEEQSFIDMADSETDKDLRTLSVEVVRASSSTYTLDDIYNLLLSVYTTYTGRASWAVFDQSIYNLIVNNFSHYDSVSGNTYDVGAMLWIIRQCLIDLSNTLVPSTAASQPSIYNLIDSINETLSLALVDANNTPYLVNIYNKLVDIDSGFIDYTSALFYNSIGVAEYASRINSAIVASYNGLYTQLNKLDTTNDKLTTINTSLQTKLTALNTHAQSIEGKIDTQTNTISNDLSSSGAIASGISSLQYDINNINFLPCDFITFLGVSDSLENARNNVFASTAHNYNMLVAKYYVSPLSDYMDYIYKFDNNFYSIEQSNYFVKFYVGNYNEPLYNISSYFTQNFSSSIICSMDFNRYSPFDLYVVLYSNNNRPYNFRLSYSQSHVSYINSNNIDFYYTYDYLSNFHNNKIFNSFKELYASDDLIAAKENQQSYEDQVISDFTGSGSASAKASDASSAKNISSAVSSGLNSGGSVNNSLSVFNPSGGFWGWFSQENSDLINTLSSQNRLRSSGSGSDWVSDDPYQRNAEELQSILGGNR